jgi:hypothetical protein
MIPSRPLACAAGPDFYAAEEFLPPGSGETRLALRLYEAKSRIGCALTQPNKLQLDGCSRQEKTAELLPGRRMPNGHS